MASLPPQQAAPASSSSAQRRSPSRHDSSPRAEEASGDRRRQSISQSTTSLDSQTVLLGSYSASSADHSTPPHTPLPPASTTNSTSNTRQTQEAPPADTSTAVVSASGAGGAKYDDVDNEPRKCWICFSDETEDSPETSRWRSPCPCALTAHEACLLDWVADLEASAARKRDGARVKVRCPQCKADIMVVRPRNLPYALLGAIDRLGARLVVPGIGLTLVGTLYTGAVVHGLSSIYVVFGHPDFERLLGIDPRTGVGQVNGAWALGLPAIPVMLVLSRLRTGDNVLPAIPLLLMAGSIPIHGLPGRLPSWPPTAAVAFASLPYLRGAYNSLWRLCFEKLERGWEQAVQPRAGEGNEALDDEAGADAHNADVAGGGGGVGNLEFELNLEVGIFDAEPEQLANNDHDVGANGQQQQAGQHQAPAEGQDREQGAAGAGGAAGMEALPQQQRGNQLILSTSRVADLIMGALSFPAVSAVMGELLRLGLPRRWTAATEMASASTSRRPGLLATKWGRSIVGGCLFVVVKDTLLLYTKYRLAQDQRRRKVLNFDKVKARIVRD